MVEGEAVLRMKKAEEVMYLTDNGNPIIDARYGANIKHPIEMEQKLKAISGVVEVGLFNELANTVLLAHEDGSVEALSPAKQQTMPEANRIKSQI